MDTVVYRQVFEVEKRLITWLIQPHTYPYFTAQLSACDDLAGPQPRGAYPHSVARAPGRGRAEAALRQAGNQVAMPIGDPLYCDAGVAQDLHEGKR